MRLHKQSRQAFTYKTSNKVAIQVIVAPRLHRQACRRVAQLNVGRHSSTHARTNVSNDKAASFVQKLVLVNYLVEFYQKLAIFLVRATAREVPARFVQFLMEVQQKWDLDLRLQRHVVFDSVKSTQYEIEDANDATQLTFQLLDHSSKATTRRIQE